MDERVSPFYNPYNPDDITTVIGNRRMEEMWDRSRSSANQQSDPRLSKFVFLLLVGVLTLLGVLDWFFS